MKAFVIAAFLVASVAAQNIDLFNLMKDKTLLKYKPYHTRSTVEDLLLQEKLGSRMDLTNTGLYDDVTSVFGGRMQVIPIDELVSYPLFREYMQIPLFRQFWVQHPIVFRRYVESPLFQQFWTVPQFQMYFRNPVLFYKYIVPQIQVIADVVPTTTEGIYNYDSVTPYNVPSYTRYNKEWSVPMTMGKTFPFGKMTTSTNTPMYYKYLLEKMMNNLKINDIRRGVTETYTDVKELPNGRIVENTVGEIIDPITGEKKVTVGDIKYVNEKIVPFTSMDFPVGMDTYTSSVYGLPTTTVKDALVKHILLNKIFGQRVMKPELYETLLGKDMTTLFPHLINKNNWSPSLLSTIFNNEKVAYPEMYDTIFNTHKTMTPELFQTVFGEHKNIITPEIYELLVKGKKDILTPTLLESVFGKKIYNPEVFGTLFNTPEVYPINKYDVDFEPIMKNKMVFNPLVHRMLRNKLMNKEFLGHKTLDMIKKEQMFEEIKKEKMLEEIKKEKVMEDLIKNKDLYTLDSEIPTLMETEKFHKVPLTFGKPILGSQIDEFQKEKEIKF